MEIAERLRELEERLLDSPVRRDPALVSALLSAGFREFGASGRVFTREQILEALRTEEPVRISLREFAAVRLGEGVYLVTYRSRRELEDGGAVEALRSSVWRLESGEWRMVFHQGTRV